MVHLGSTQGSVCGDERKQAMPYLISADGHLLLCPAHGERPRHGARFVGLRAATSDEVARLGGECADCVDHGPAVVASIRVGGEAHCVQDADGNLVDEILASEQCDSCGSTRDDGSQAPFVLGASGGSACYICEQCGAEYRIGRTADTETVF